MDSPDIVQIYIGKNEIYLKISESSKSKHNNLSRQLRWIEREKKVHLLYLNQIKSQRRKFKVLRKKTFLMSD